MTRRSNVKLVLLVALLCPGRAHAGDPSQRWSTIETPHFYIHYYRNIRHDEARVAQLVARAAELAHARIVPALRHAPSGKTHVVVTDDTDGANGSAQIVPMNIVRLYMTGPTSLSTLNDYDDWIYGLILHEYAHILHIDTIHGLARIVNYVLGKTWAPNQVQPRWFIEGVSTYYESARSGGGRNRGTIHDMYLRAAVLEGKLLEIDQISSWTRYIPRGNVPYLYGGRFLQYLMERFGEQKLADVTHAYGGTIIPWAINRVAKQKLGHTYIELYDDFKRHLRRRYELQRAAAASRGLTVFRRITDHGESTASPVFSADGRELVYLESDGHSMWQVKVMDVASGRIKEGHDLYGGSGVGMSPDRRHLIYGEASVWRTFYAYDDLFVRDRVTGKVRRLTHGLRSRDPAVSPDGTQVAFVTNDLWTMDLALIPFEGGTHRVLLRGTKGDQVHTPRWSPDGKQIVYSRWSAGGYRDVHILDVATGRQRRLTADRALDTDPMFSPDGKRVYFSSDRTGIFNIFCHDLEEDRLYQVSNVLGGAFSPAISPDEREAYYVGFSARGFDLHAMKLDRTAFLPALPYVDDRPAPTVIDEPKPKDAYPARPYSPLPTLYPRAWSYQMGNDIFGTALGISLSGEDVVGRHSWALALRSSTTRENVSYTLAYVYSRLWPSIGVDTSRTKGVRGGVVIDGVRKNYVEENYGAGAGVSLPVLRLPSHSVDLSLGYRFNWFNDADGTRVLVRPGDLSSRLPETGILSGLTFGLTYSNVQRYTWSISNEKGRILSLAVRTDHPWFGSDYQSTAVSYWYNEFIPMPLRDHVLALRLAGGVSSGSLARRSVFYLGGFPEQDTLRALFDQSRIGGAYLRGYPQGVVAGDQYHLLNVEYRLPLFNIERGFSSLPLYFTHVHAAAFLDVGNAFFGQLDLSQLKVGVGAELLVEAAIGYVLGATFIIGYARGLMDKGGDQWHFLVGYPF